MSERQVDLLCIGAGGAAYPAAFRLARAGRKVLMVDPKGVMSGNCLYEGCVPSKAVREMANLTADVQRFHPQLGLMTVKADYAAIIEHKDRVQQRRYDQHAQELAAAPNITLRKGVVRILDPHTVQINDDQGSEKIHCAHILIASGSDVFVPPIPGAEYCLTSHDLYKPEPALRKLPPRLIVIGGGYIGLETASFFAQLGSQVTLLQKGEQILNGMDPGMVALLQPLLPASLQILTDVDVQRIEAQGALRTVVWKRGGPEEHAQAEVVLLAVGRSPVVPEGCDYLGIAHDRHGIQVAASLQTRYPHIYAAGDVNGRVPLFHAAVRQSLVAAHNILAGNVPQDYADFHTVPTTIFTLPAAAYIGMTPAKVEGKDLLEGHYAFAEDSRAQILDRTEGEIRLFFETDSLRLLGAWVVGIDAGNLIGQLGTALQMGATAYDLARFADQHPMSAEGIGKAARSLF
ncbi:dihydrolipoyl dehydrogenase [Acidithiobacillus acidisediminis]|uniref:dihydrolipoyl dehydrogenase n=1 Tax=Acidithiobacillus TaxID=119977 RepID=UPI00200CA1B5|nr:dihydrolipoyl dehydrogenase [Acidithiobacillus sp. S30A2]